jgi:TPR repeat protein
MMMVIGCEKKSRQIDYSKGVCPANDFYLTDAEIVSFTAKASTNAAAAYRLYFYYGGYRFDTKSSMAWLRKAAEGGSAQAECSLGIFMMCSPGYINLEESKSWLTKSAAQGYEPAKEMLSNSAAGVRP